MQELRFNSSYGSIWHDCPCVNLNLEKTKNMPPQWPKSQHIFWFHVHELNTFSNFLGYFIQYCLQFNDDIIASGSADSTVRLWSHQGRWLFHFLWLHLVSWCTLTRLLFNSHYVWQVSCFTHWRSISGWSGACASQVIGSFLVETGSASLFGIWRYAVMLFEEVLRNFGVCIMKRLTCYFSNFFFNPY